jgi:DNA (cytosine-5)-methyltransferase 1
MQPLSGASVPEGLNMKHTDSGKATRKYTEALETLRGHFRSAGSECSECPEFDAALCHWLMSPETTPPFWSADLTRLAEEALSSLCSMSTGRQLLLPSVNPTDYSFSFEGVPFPPPMEHSFTFIDLFAGIGGTRIAFQDAGGKCVFSSEWDRFSQKTYSANFGETPYGDIKAIDEQDIPDHDVLVAGFPCQPFSLAGVSKKNALGRAHGFDDKIQGTLFFDIARILAEKRPTVFFLENVKNLVSHDSGRTFETVKATLSKLGYVFKWRIVDASAWVPQHRERIFIVGLLGDHPAVNEVIGNAEKIRIPAKPEAGYERVELRDIVNQDVDERYTLGPGTWATLERHKAHHAAEGNGFGYGLITVPIEMGQQTRTISARYHKDGAEILIEQPNHPTGRPRRLTPQEAMQLMGLDPKRFRFPVSDTQKYRQIGNSVVIPAVRPTARFIASILKKTQA